MNQTVYKHEQQLNNEVKVAYPSSIVKNLAIGPLPVKTIVSINAQNAEQAIEQAGAIANNNYADIAELRIDALEFAHDASQVIALGHKLNAILVNKPLLATIRTAQEGGNLIISDTDYIALNYALLDQPFMQLLDLEMFRDQDELISLIQHAHTKGIMVMVSNHEPKHALEQDQIISRLKQQVYMGADILKIAIMPKTKYDVLELMQATLIMSEQTSKPLLTMAMGQLGTISRIAAANIGASLSFGSIGESSAAGQVEVSQLKHCLDLVKPNKDD